MTPEEFKTGMSALRALGREVDKVRNEAAEMGEARERALGGVDDDFSNCCNLIARLAIAVSAIIGMPPMDGSDT